MLRAHRTAQHRAGLLAGAVYVPADGGARCSPADGSPRPPVFVNRLFRALAAAADVPVIRVYDGHHTAAALGLESGLDDAAAERVDVDALVFGTRVERTSSNEPT